MDDVYLTTHVPARNRAVQDQVLHLLAMHDLGFDEDIEIMVLAMRASSVVGCLGLAGGVLKCAAIHPSLQGQDLIPRLMEQMNYIALDRGISHLFLYTKPANQRAFESAGFHAIAKVPELVVLMENTANGITRYAERLARQRVEGERIAGIVINANPFTLGHRHLIQTAAQECDVVHVFVVAEDVSLFSYADRLALVRAGVAALPEAQRIHVHEGSRYIVSRATFPSYFLKDKANIAAAATGLDLQLFREHIAPALGIRHRYVGTEPHSAITNLYNREMRYWLANAVSLSPSLEVHEVPRIRTTPPGRDNVWVGDVISATTVREYLAAGDVDALTRLVPPSTLELIKAKYVGVNPEPASAPTRD